MMKEYPTLSGVLVKVKEQCGCMWRVLQELGYSYINEQQNIREQRHTQTIWKLRRENVYNLVYTDETWVNAHHTNNYMGGQ